MLVTNDDHLADLARSLRAHGWSRDMSTREELERANPRIDPHFLFINVGYNLRPTEMQAAFGIVQLTGSRSSTRPVGRTPASSPGRSAASPTRG